MCDISGKLFTVITGTLLITAFDLLIRFVRKERLQKQLKANQLFLGYSKTFNCGFIALTAKI